MSTQELNTSATQRDAFSPKEIAPRLGLSISTVRRRIRDGELPCVQLGGKHHRQLIPASILQELLSQAITNTVERVPLKTPRKATQERELSGPSPDWMNALDSETKNDA